jgi:hypothetical protein
MQGTASLKTELFNKLKAAGLLGLEDPEEIDAAQAGIATSEVVKVR